MPGLKGPILGVIFVPLITFGMYSAALEAQSGGMREFSGRNAALKSLIYSAGSALGPTGSLVVGAVLALAAIGWLVMTIQKRRQLANAA